MSNDMAGQPAQMAGQAAVIRATVHITRAATGETETHELVFAPLNDPRAEDMRPIPDQQKEAD